MNGTPDTKPNIVGIIQARMTSSRLPGKVLIDLAGKPMLQHVAERVGRARLVDRVVIATTENDADRPIFEMADSMGVLAVGGSERDVLGRFHKAAVQAEADIAVRITGDCPLLEPALSDQVIEALIHDKADYAANNHLKRTFPRGVDTEVVTFQTLETMVREADQPYQREHVTPFVVERPERFRHTVVEAPDELRRSDLRLCVDEENDLQVVRAIFDHFGADPEDFSTVEVIRFLDERPELKALTLDVHQADVPNAAIPEYELQQKSSANGEPPKQD